MIERAELKRLLAEANRRQADAERAVRAAQAEVKRSDERYARYGEEVKALTALLHLYYPDEKPGVVDF